MKTGAKWTRRKFLEAGGATMGLALAGFPKARPKRPNLIFIFPDQLRGQSLGYMGQEQVKTPNIDRLAAESAVFPYTFAN